MNIEIRLTQNDLRKIVARHISEVIGGVDISPDNVLIEVKSKQNYKAEWEPAEWRAIYIANA